ncbi:MAG: hypothetical protein H5T64_07050 [Chloroflexi bacterium]|nr:hypothetical protein [Chloroflexota bacterium]
MIIHPAIIRAFDEASWTATVELVGYENSLLMGVPVAMDIRPDLIAPGVQCGVLLFDDINPADGCVFCLYGATPAPDPRFDPVHGHRHRGLEGDGPKL